MRKFCSFEKLFVRRCNRIVSRRNRIVRRWRSPEQASRKITPMSGKPLKPVFIPCLKHRFSRSRGVKIIGVAESEYQQYDDVLNFL